MVDAERASRLQPGEWWAERARGDTIDTLSSTRTLPRATRTLLGLARAELGLAPPPPVESCRDWPALLQLASQQGMTPALCRWALSNKQLLSAETRESVVSLNRQLAVTSLVLSQLLLTTSKLCDAEQIPCLFWKGPVLAAQLRGDPSSRQYGDIDILVPAKDVLRLHHALRKSRFKPLYDLTDPQLLWLKAISGENCYLEGTGRIALDVHWSLVSPRLSLGGGYDQFSQPPTTVRVDGREVHCPSLERHLVMLAIHGCKHAWSALGWLFDVATLSAKAELDWAVAWQAAREASAQRMLSLALDLCRRVLGMTLPPAATGQMQRSASLTWATRVCEDSLVAEKRSKSLSVFLATMPGIGNRASYVTNLFLDPTTLDFELIRLPEALFPLYYAVRPVRLAGKHIFGVKQRLRRER